MNEWLNPFTVSAAVEADPSTGPEWMRQTTKNKINMTSNKSAQINFQINDKQLCLSGYPCNRKNLLNPQP